MATMGLKKQFLKLPLFGIILGGLVMYISHTVYGNEDEVCYNIPFTESMPTIDGKISEGEWVGANIIDLDNETEPSQNVPAIVNTEVYMMEDGCNFYLAFIASDPEPEKIRAFFSDRDTIFEDDRVGVILDTFNDEKRSFQFFTNPFGVQMDSVSSEMGGGFGGPPGGGAPGFGGGMSWNAIWDSAGKITDKGYIVEMKIPLDQLRFHSGLEKQIWGIDLVRYYPRDKRHKFSNNIKDYNVSCYLCQLKKAEGFKNLEQGLNLRVVPTLTGTYTEHRMPPGTWDTQTSKMGTGKWQNDKKLDGGVDIRWGINQSSYLNATINPDFSQVEADVAQLNVNSTYSLYYPEKREFFLEGSDYFNTPANLVHSRNILSPDVGIKLTGKHDVHSYGLFFTNDTATNLIIPGREGNTVVSLNDTKSLNTAFRYRSDLNKDINFGVIFTNRRADDYANTITGLNGLPIYQAGDYKNTVAGIDGNIRLGISDTVTMQLLSSYTKYPQNFYDQKENINDYAYSIDYSHDDMNWFWSTRYEEYGDDFRADMGFITRVDYNELGLNFGHKWLFGPGSRFNRIFLGSGFDWIRDEDGKKIGDNFDITLNIEGPMQSFMFLTLKKGEELYNGLFFDKDTVSLFGRIRPYAGVDISMDISYGDDIDYYNNRQGKQFSFGPWVDLKIGKHFLASMRHNYQKMEVNGQKLYSTNLTDLRFTYQFTIRSFLRVTAQYNDTRYNSALYTFDMYDRYKTLTTQLLYSYKITPQTRFYIGYSDTGFQDDMRSNIYKTDRNIFTKISYEL
jgi:hypothetical protein